MRYLYAKDCHQFSYSRECRDYTCLPSCTSTLCYPLTISRLSRPSYAVPCILYGLQADHLFGEPSASSCTYIYRCPILTPPKEAFRTGPSAVYRIGIPPQFPPLRACEPSSNRAEEEGVLVCAGHRLCSSVMAGSSCRHTSPGGRRRGLTYPIAS